MAKFPRCEKCWLRGRYDRSASSILGRLWHWHAGWCPGWKGYISALPEAERRRLAEHYKLDKFR